MEEVYSFLRPESISDVFSTDDLKLCHMQNKYLKNEYEETIETVC